MPAPAPQSQKSVLGGLIAFGILAIVLGMLQIQRAIRPTRATAPSSIPTIPRTREELEAAQRAAVAGVDTDRDGLDDLTELEATRTSPFLADSDSDGKTDKEEVDAGEDPNCPKGKLCVSGPPAEAAPRPAPPPLDFPGAPIGNPMADSATAAGTQQIPTPAELRRGLTAQGVSPALLQSLTDEQLLSTYRGLLGSITKLPTGEDSPIAGSLSALLEGAFRGGSGGGAQGAFDALPSDPKEIRDLLMRGGFPRDQLQQMNDQALLSVWRQAIDSLKQSPATGP
ncbi:hypothetical protein HY634_02210 [Candidatus Uhrbacteria bacterium]|nr:hypothetical protein [Candidatus Uhrbacteria bacterium]